MIKIEKKDIRVGDYVLYRSSYYLIIATAKTKHSHLPILILDEKCPALLFDLKSEERWEILNSCKNTKISFKELCLYCDVDTNNAFRKTRCDLCLVKF